MALGKTRDFLCEKKCASAHFFNELRKRMNCAQHMNWLRHELHLRCMRKRIRIKKVRHGALFLLLLKAKAYSHQTFPVF
jgi:hypothetical protein